MCPKNDHSNTRRSGIRWVTVDRILGKQITDQAVLLCSYWCNVAIKMLHSFFLKAYNMDNTGPLIVLFSLLQIWLSDLFQTNTYFKSNPWNWYLLLLILHLQDTSAAKDVVQVHNIVAGGAKPRKPFPSKSIESSEGASSQGKSDTVPLRKPDSPAFEWPSLGHFLSPGFRC
jgi:hypothetical protein